MKISPGPRQGADANWQDGWLERAIRVASPNYGPRPASTPVDLIVVHSISLPPGEYGGTFVQQLFTNQLDWDAHPYFQQIRGAEVSAHFYIQRTGQLIQFVSTQQRAWHAGKSQWCGRDNCNDFSIGIELEGLEDHPFETIAHLGYPARAPLGAGCGGSLGCCTRPQTGSGRCIQLAFFR